MTLTMLTTTATAEEIVVRNPDKMVYEVQKGIELILYPDQCKSNPQLGRAEAVNKELGEKVEGCWFRRDGTVMIDLYDGKNIYNYAYYEYRFTPQWN